MDEQITHERRALTRIVQAWMQSQQMSRNSTRTRAHLHLAATRDHSLCGSSQAHQAGLRQPAADGSGHILAENSLNVSDVAASAAPASCQGVRGSPPKALALWQIAAAASPVDSGWSHGAEHRLCATGPLPTSRKARGQRERTRVALLIRNSIAAHHCRGANPACTRDART